MNILLLVLVSAGLYATSLKLIRALCVAMARCGPVPKSWVPALYTMSTIIASTASVFGITILSAVAMNAVVPADMRVAYANTLCFNGTVDHQGVCGTIVQNGATLFVFASNILSGIARTLTFDGVAPAMIDHACPR